MLYRSRQWHPTPVLLPGKSHGWRSLEGCSPWGLLRIGHDWATSLSLFTFMHCRRKWHPLQCSCPENPRDSGAWWAAVYRVAQGQTRLKWLSSRCVYREWTRICNCFWSQSRAGKEREMLWYREGMPMSWAGRQAFWLGIPSVKTNREKKLTRLKKAKSDGMWDGGESTGANEILEYSFFLPWYVAYEILVPRPGIEAGPPAAKAQSPNHWTSRQFQDFLNSEILF